MPPVEVAKEPAAPDTAAQRLQRLVPREYAERLLASGGQMAGERRMVTILMSDIKGSSAMARGMDPEDVMEIMDGAFEVLIKPIARYEGTVARLEGDAIMAFFGAPIAHEDDPERACRAGLEIVEGTRAYAERLERERGIGGFNVRVGIHTGLVVVGEVGTDLRVEYTAMGEAPNLTARLESAAEPGTVLISEEAHRLIAPLFQTQVLEPIEVKGWQQPVPVFRVLAAKEVPRKVRGVAGLESPLVGRDAEFGALQGAVERLRTGVGGIVTLVGEAGIGKSRLVAELRKENLAKVCEPDGSREPSQGLASPQWVEGRCLSYGTTIPYLPWLDVLRSALGVSLEESPAAVAETLARWVEGLCPEGVDAVYPYLARLLSLPLEEKHEAMLDQLDGQQLRERTFAAVQTTLRCFAEREPLVMVLEDLHWADSISTALLEQLLALTDRVPLLLWCVFRPRTEHGCWQLRETAARDYRHRHTDLWLDPLSPGESEALVGNLLEVEGLPVALKRRILSHAEGNPFYVEEIIRSLIDEGAIVQREVSGLWEATRDVAEISIPDTLQGVLLARIDRLQEDTKGVLQMASVIGRIFLYRILAAIAEEGRDLDEHLITLQRQELIREQARLPELEYVFKHELAREAAYNGLLKKERRALHRRVAEALERLFPERAEEQVGLLAHHWERGGDAEKATAYLLRAGDRARALGAFQEAIGYYERAVGLLREGGDADRTARTLMTLGLTYHNAFQFEQARGAYEEGFAQWQRAAEMAPAALQPAPHALRVHWRPVATLDPAYVLDGDSAGVMVQLLAGLVTFDGEWNVVPDVARTWEVSEGGRRYIFHLRDDVTWSDGVRVTAGDFEFAWIRMLEPASHSPNAHFLHALKGARDYHAGRAVDPSQVGVRALDERTLVVELEGPSGYFLQLLATPAGAAVPSHRVRALGRDWANPEHIVTSGPFRLTEWDRDGKIVLERDPTYHGRFGGNVKQVVLALGDPAGGIEAYEADGLDVVHMVGLTSLDVRALDRARQRHPDQYLSTPQLATMHLGFHVGRPPFDDRRVRRALALAIDLEWLAGVVLGGLVFPATGGLVPPGMPGHSAGIGLPYDPEQATRLLGEAGYRDGRGFPTIECVMPWGAAALSIADFVSTSWLEHLHLRLSWEGLPWGALHDRLDAGSPHLWIMCWIADYPDPENFLRVAAWRRDTRWQNRVYDDLLTAAERSANAEQRIEVYQQADRILMEELPIVPVAYERGHQLVKPWIRFAPQAVDLPRWQGCIVEPH